MKAVILLLLCLITTCQASELTEIGHAIGNGSHIMEVSGVNITNMTNQEVVYVLGPGHNLNISRDGVLTLGNGTQYKIVQCNNTKIFEEDKNV